MARPIADLAWRGPLPVVRVPRPRPAPVVPVLYVCGCGKFRGHARTSGEAAAAVRLHRAQHECDAPARVIGLVRGWQ